MDEMNEIRAVCDTYKRATGRSLNAPSIALFNRGGQLQGILDGTKPVVTVPKRQLILQWFSDRWHALEERWPAGVRRPVPDPMVRIAA